MREVIKERMAKCKRCKFYTEAGRCGTINEKVKYQNKNITLCGCFMNEKTQWAFASCPAGKWGAYEGWGEQHVDKVREVYERYEGEPTKANLIKVYEVYKELMGDAGRHINPRGTGCGDCRRNRLEEIRLYLKKVDKC
jgi:hypothetical protein